MDNLKQNLPHMIMATVLIAAVTVLAVTHIISGPEALGIIGPTAGFTMAAGAGSASPTPGAASIPAASLSPGQTVTETTTHQIAATPGAPPAN